MVIQLIDGRLSLSAPFLWEWFFHHIFDSPTEMQEFDKFWLNFEQFWFLKENIISFGIFAVLWNTLLYNNLGDNLWRRFIFRDLDCRSRFCFVHPLHELLEPVNSEKITRLRSPCKLVSWLLVNTFYQPLAAWSYGGQHPCCWTWNCY